MPLDYVMLFIKKNTFRENYLYIDEMFAVLDG